jgi:hypothetical protein
MNSNKPSTESLKNIKKHLENKLDESSDSTYESSDDNSNNKSLKYRNLETKLRYMQLEMVNKDIEISDLTEKLHKFNTSDALFNKINFLFDRLNNANNILIEKTININNNPISVLLQHKELCNKVIEKYNQLYKLGFTNLYVYIGGLFEWLLLQDIYGEDEFPTTSKIYDILNYKGKSVSK